MKTLPDKLIYPMPFAGGANALLTPFAEGADTDKINFETGFPDKYSTPKSKGGKFVTRGEMNYLGNIATKNDYYKMCGGINTFDPVFAGKIGGYPKDAILDYFDGINLFKVISLVEDNKHDFLVYGLGDKWGKLGTNDVIPSSGLVVELKDINLPLSLTSITCLGYFVSKYNGLVYTKISDFSETEDNDEHNVNESGYLKGTAILCRAFKNYNDIVVPTVEYKIISSNSGYLTNFNGYSVLGGLPSKSIISGISLSGSTGTTVYPSYDPVIAQAGDILSIYAINGYHTYNALNGGTYLGNKFKFTMSIFAG